MAYSLLRKAAEITGFSHRELSEVVGVSRILVQKICQGTTPEYLTAPQIEALLQTVRLFVAVAQQGLEEMERFS